MSLAANATPLSRPSRSGGCGETSTHARISPSHAAMRASQPSIPSDRRSIEPTLYLGLPSIEVEGEDKKHEHGHEQQSASCIVDLRNLRCRHHGFRLAGICFWVCAIPYANTGH